MFDGHRVLVNRQCAGRLARCRTDAAREFREVIGGVKLNQGLLPSSPVDQVVPVRDQVAKRAARMAKGYATAHASAALVSGLLLSPMLVELAVVLDAFRYRLMRLREPLLLFKSCRFTHSASSELSIIKIGAGVALLYD